MRRSLVLLSAAIVALAGTGCPSFPTTPGTRYACSQPSDCDGLDGAVCDPVQGVCVWGPNIDGGLPGDAGPGSCVGPSDCPTNYQHCNQGHCVAFCAGSLCAPGQVCPNGACVPADGLPLSSDCPPGFFLVPDNNGGTTCGRACASYVDCLPGWSCGGHTGTPPKRYCVPNACQANYLNGCDLDPGTTGSAGVCVGPLASLDADGGVGLCYAPGGVRNDLHNPWPCNVDVPFGDGGEACVGMGASTGYCTAVGSDGGTVCQTLCSLMIPSPCIDDAGCYPMWASNGICIIQNGPLGDLDAGCTTPFSASTPPGGMECKPDYLCVGDGGVNHCKRACQVESTNSCGSPKVCTSLGLPGNLAGLGYCAP